VSPFLGLFEDLWIIYNIWIEVLSIVTRRLKNPTNHAEIDPKLLASIDTFGNSFG
jgi:hypothetical protein